MLNKTKKFLADTQALKPIITDTGETVLSQAQIDKWCEKTRQIIDALTEGGPTNA